MKSKPALKRVRFIYEALCEVDAAAESMDLATVILECREGDMSGKLLDTEVRLLDLKQARLACAEHGTDPEFFHLPVFPVGTRVWWADPDEGLCSGWGTITGFQGDMYYLKMDGSGDTEACLHELSLKKPKAKQ